MKELFADYKEGGKKRQLVGNDKRIIKVIAVIMSLYQLWQSVFSSMQPQMHYAIHLTFILVLCYLYFTPSQNKDRTKISKIDYIVAAIIIVIGIYYVSQIQRYLVRWPQVDPLSAADIIFGIILAVLVIDATRRTMGMVLPSIGIFFLLYALFGDLLPGSFGHRFIAPIDILDQLVFTTNGIFTSPIAVSSTFVFLFCLFGSFFNHSGAGAFFHKFSMAVAGKYAGGAGKVSVISSGLFGMINGSPTANVATIGSFTIPMMKREGYDSVFAGAISAVSSTGGGIMPPIMGTAAFLMVEMAGVPYKNIAIAAAIPAALYYGSLLLICHLRAKKTGLKGLPDAEVPNLKQTIKEGFLFFIPLIVLVGMIMMGYTPSLAAVAGIVCVIIASSLKKETRMNLETIIKALEEGALSSIIVSLSCAVAGMVICGLMITGLTGKIASLVLSVGGGSLFAALLITAALCTLLGMGMPVAAAYALTASLAIPSLIELGVPLIAAHMFVVYYSTFSAITPPVAVASYAAAGIADANATKIGWAACRIGIICFIVPFMFVFDTSLLAEPSDFLNISTYIMILTAFLGVYSLSASSEGYLKAKLNIAARVLLFAAGLTMIYPEALTSTIGIAVFVAIYLIQTVKIKKSNEQIAIENN